MRSAFTIVSFVVGVLAGVAVMIFGLVYTGL